MTTNKGRGISLVSDCEILIVYRECVWMQPSLNRSYLIHVDLAWYKGASLHSEMGKEIKLTVRSKGSGHYWNCVWSSFLTLVVEVREHRYIMHFPLRRKKRNLCGCVKRMTKMAPNPWSDPSVKAIPTFLLPKPSELVCRMGREITTMVVRWVGYSTHNGPYVRVV